jgi:hypothetical protein
MSSKNNIKIKKLQIYTNIIINSLSSFSTGLWLLNKLPTKLHLLIEIFLLSTKTPIEYYCNNLNKNLIFHHLAMYIGTFISFTKQYSIYQNIISMMQIIHFPFNLYWCHRAIKLNKKKNNYFNNLYLITWFPFSIYRNVYISKKAFENFKYNNKDKLLLSTFSLGFIYLDYKWTPWNKYKKLNKFII